MPYKTRSRSNASSKAGWTETSTTPSSQASSRQSTPAPASPRSYSEATRNTLTPLAIELANTNLSENEPLLQLPVIHASPRTPPPAEAKAAAEEMEVSERVNVDSSAGAEPTQQAMPAATEPLSIGNQPEPLPTSQRPREALSNDAVHTGGEGLKSPEMKRRKESTRGPTENVPITYGYNHRSGIPPSSFMGGRGFNAISSRGCRYESPLKRDSGRRQSAPFRDEPEKTWSYEEAPPRYFVAQRSVNNWIAVIDPAYAHDPEFAGAPTYIHVTPSSFPRDGNDEDPNSNALVLGECLELLRAEHFRNRPVQRHDVPVKNHLFKGLIRASATATAVRRLPREKPFLSHVGVIVSHKENARGFRVFTVNVRYFDDKSISVSPAAVHPTCRNLVTGDEVRVLLYTPPNGSSWPEDKSYLLPAGSRARTDEKVVTSDDKIIAMISPLREPTANAANDASGSDARERQLPNPFSHVKEATQVSGAVRDFQDVCLASNARAHEKYCQEMEKVYYTGRLTPVEHEESTVVFKTWSVDSDRIYNAHAKFWRPDAIVSVYTESNPQSEKPRKLGSGVILAVEADESRREFEIKMSVEPVKGGAQKPEEMQSSDLSRALAGDLPVRVAFTAAHTSYAQQRNLYRNNNLLRVFRKNRPSKAVIASLLGIARFVCEPPKATTEPLLTDVSMLNEEQVEALKLALGSAPAKFQDSPAGSGKSLVCMLYLLELLQRLKDNETVLFTPETNDVEFALLDKLFKKLIDLGLLDPADFWVLESGTHRRQHLDEEEPVWAECRLSAHAEKLLEDAPEGLKPAQVKQIRQFIEDSREGRAVNIDESVALRACLAHKRPRIIFATVGMAMRNHTRLQRIVTHACIDEAGHSTEMEIVSLLTMYEQIRSLFLTGDPKQARDDAISHPDAVQRHSFYPITDVLKARGVPTVTLKVCYRMQRALMEAVSHSSYDGGLQCGISDQDRSLFKRIPADVPKEVPVLVFNSDDADVRTLTRSRHNPAQTDGVLHASEYLRHHFPDSTIAIICYYGSQAKILRQQTRHLSATCVTVDGFVGKEADFVVACVSRSVPADEQVNPLQYGFVLNNNRATVVQSRAREGLILVGQVKLLREGERWRKYLENVEAKAPFHELSELRSILNWTH